MRGHHDRILLGLAAAIGCIAPVLFLGLVSPAGAATPSGSTSVASLIGFASGSTSTTVAPSSSTTTAGGSSQADMTLDALMLATPLPGLVTFTLVGPGATNGPLTAQTLASYSSDPQQVEHLFDQYSSESGFAGWIKTWQDPTGSSQVVEIAIRFHQANEATTNASAFVSTLSKGLSGGTRNHVPSIPGASAFTIDEAPSTSGNVSIPAQQVQAVVFADGSYLIALHTDSPDGAGATPIAGGTAIALALQQYQVLSPPTVAPHGTKAPSKSSSSGGSTILVVGLVMLFAVAIVIVAIGMLSWRRRQSGAHRATVSPSSRRLPSEEVAAKPEGAQRAGSRAWPGAPAAPDGSQERVKANGRDGHMRAEGSPDRTTPDLATPDQGTPNQGTPNQGTPNQGTPEQGAPVRATPYRGRPSQRQSKKRVPIGRLGRTADPGPKTDEAEKLVEAGATSGRSSRSHRMAHSRTKHPSAAAALANARPPTDAAGWYSDPSDGQKRRIRYWDGSSWTSHVAEPEA
jgi:hypothetical protein